jgi:hypothetical protein
MATTYPRVLLDADCKSDAEREVFSLLKARLDDPWEVFHSAGWVARHPGTGADDGEIDFVLVHPERGVVCLEVKGGAIGCNHGEWERRAIRSSRRSITATTFSGSSMPSTVGAVRTCSSSTPSHSRT